MTSHSAELSANAPWRSGESSPPVDEAHVIGRVGKRLMWLLMALYFVAIMDRGNVSFASLTMNRDIGLDAQSYGFGIGITQFVYAICETPSNLVLGRFGARWTLTRIAILWGVVSMCAAFAMGPLSFYGIRALLGAAEAGLFPGVILYLSFWFPYRYRARFNTLFCLATPLAYIFTSLISGSILELDGTLGLAGWKWLFILEGIPAIALGAIVFFYLTEKPKDALWLAADEREWLQTTIDQQRAALGTIHEKSFWHILKNPLVLLLAAIHFAFFCGLVALSAWLPQIVRSYGLSFHMVGVVAALPPVVGAFGMYFMSRRSDRRGERIYHSIGVMLLAALGFGLVSISHSLPVAIFGFMLANVGVYSTQVIFWTIPQSFLSKEVAAGGLGLINTLGSIGGLVIASSLGRIQHETHSLTSGFIIVSVLFIFAAGVMLAVGRMLKKTHPAPA